MSAKPNNKNFGHLFAGPFFSSFLQQFVFIGFYKLSVPTD